MSQQSSDALTAPKYGVMDTNHLNLSANLYLPAMANNSMMTPYPYFPIMDPSTSMQMMPTYTPMGAASPTTNSQSPQPAIPSQNHKKYQYNNSFPTHLTKFQHSKRQQKSARDSNGKIIQCPNPTHNPILHHQQQQEIADCEHAEQNKAKQIESLQQKVNEQMELIQSLMAQNQVLSTELASSKSENSSLQSQNNALLAAYNTLESRWKAIVVPTLMSAKKPIYEDWSVQQVVAWVNALDDGKYTKYRYCFVLNNIDGKVLQIVNRPYLERLGVKDRNDQSGLLGHIEQLKQVTNTTDLIAAAGMAEKEKEGILIHQSRTSVCL